MSSLHPRYPHTKLPSCSSTYIGPLIPTSTIATTTPMPLWQFAQIIHTYFWFHLTNWSSFLSTTSPLPCVSLSYPASLLLFCHSAYPLCNDSSTFSRVTSPAIGHSPPPKKNPKRREENQLDATECFIAFIICSTCFRPLYAHRKELETILVSLPHMVCNALVGCGRLLGAEQHAMRPECGQSHNFPHPGRISCCSAPKSRLPPTKASHTICGNNTSIVLSSWWWAYKSHETCWADYKCNKAFSSI